MINYQGKCYWCRMKLYSPRVWDIEFFYNQKYIGYPICNECIRGLKTHGYPKDGIGNKKQPKEEMSLRKWL